MEAKLKDATEVLSNRVRAAEWEVREVLVKLAKDIGTDVKSCYVDIVPSLRADGRMRYDVAFVAIEVNV